MRFGGLQTEIQEKQKYRNTEINVVFVRFPRYTLETEKTTCWRMRGREGGERTMGGRVDERRASG